MDNRARLAKPLEWLSSVGLPCVVVQIADEIAVEHPGGQISPPFDTQGVDRTDSIAGGLAVRALLRGDGFPESWTPGDLLWRHDLLGKPYVSWHGGIAQWAAQNRRDHTHLHVSNSHDGGVDLVLAAYEERLAGVGVDVVYLPRLRAPAKNSAYLRRFASHFMSDREREAFEQAAQNEELEALRRRVAAHFSLMEAASKALGTGLKIGGGMGHAASMPKQAAGVSCLAPEVELLFEGPALTRLELLGVNGWKAYWGADDDFLISGVFLLK